MNDADREQKLQRLADENGYWADEELRLIETIREHKRRLTYLPDIIRWLNEKLERVLKERKQVMAEMNRTGAEYDALEAEGRAAKIDKGFMDWANAQDAEVTDWQETTRRPNY